MEATPTLAARLLPVVVNEPCPWTGCVEWRRSFALRHHAGHNRKQSYRTDSLCRSSPRNAVCRRRGRLPRQPRPTSFPCLFGGASNAAHGKSVCFWSRRAIVSRLPRAETKEPRGRVSPRAAGIKGGRGRRLFATAASPTTPNLPSLLLPTAHLSGHDPRLFAQP
jgi:hypothetical protein